MVVSWGHTVAVCEDAHFQRTVEEKSHKILNFLYQHDLRKINFIKNHYGGLNNDDVPLSLNSWNRARWESETVCEKQCEWQAGMELSHSIPKRFSSIITEKLLRAQEWRKPFMTLDTKHISKWIRKKSCRELD